MKAFFRISLINVIFILFLSFSVGFAGNKKEYPTSPPAKIAKKWRIAYLEGGPWRDYQSALIATVEGLSKLGWTEEIAIPRPKDIHDTGELWPWLAANVKSRYLEFAADAYYSNNWDEESRKKTKAILIKRLSEDRDIDLIIVMGTWAGQDLANNSHSVPTVVASTTDAVAAKIVKSVEDSGYDHVHARVDPALYERQIRAFHDLLGFKKLGVPFKDSVTGRSYAAIEHIEKVAEERQFQIIPYYMKYTNTDKKSPAEMIECARELAPKIDAYYAPMHDSINPKTLPEILAALNEYKVPTFSQHSDLVRYGLLLTVATVKFEGRGMFYAKTIARIINGAKPRALGQVYETPVKIAFNKAAAKIIDLRDDIYHLLSETADEVYEEIEVSK
ncbi:ABC transporter substrate binding protein [Desulfococcaceae bacterium HSG8]|nr:ABC transporter substrate binding protein [Desulfococcaceae bacterium HSG8]